MPNSAKWNFTESRVSVWLSTFICPWWAANIDFRWDSQKLLPLDFSNLSFPRRLEGGNSKSYNKNFKLKTTREKTVARDFFGGKIKDFETHMVWSNIFFTGRNSFLLISVEYIRMKIIQEKPIIFIWMWEFKSSSSCFQCTNSIQTLVRHSRVWW